MPGWFGKLRDAATRNPVMQVDDAELGALEYNESWWESSIPSKEGTIKLCVGGRYEPDPALIEMARATAKRIDMFIDEVKAHCSNEAGHNDFRTMPGVAEEIASLRISDIHYVWPKTPAHGMIYFNGPDELKIWHCDIEDGKLLGLTFDS
jgi:hypothetical protein